jgi:prepilin-type N-terminal cleavage/methylation domain-containing protein
MSTRDTTVSGASASWAPAGRRRSRGFSLLEMLVAAAVLAVGLVIVTESISAGLTAATRTERRLFAGRRAADRLNRAAAEPSSALPGEGQSRWAGVPHHWRVEQAGARNGLRHLRCTVAWQSRGRQRTVSLERFVPAQAQEPTSP